MSHRILIIEDNEDLRNTLGDALEMMGYDVETAPDGPTGLQTALAHMPEAALVDIGLPGIDGFQVAQGIRQSLGKDMLLVALSGYGQDSDRERALQAGFNTHLTKPASISVLRKTLAQLDLK